MVVVEATARQQPLEGLEPATGRVVVHAAVPQVPLAHHVAAVAQLVQVLGHQGEVGVEAGWLLGPYHRVLN